MPQRQCINHTERPAAGQCNLCHKPICEECRYGEAPAGLFCSRECYDKHLAYGSRKQAVLHSSRLKSMVIGIVVLAVVAAVAVYVGGGMLKLPVLRSVYQAIF